MAKYEKLTEHLGRCKASGEYSVALTFAAIDGMVGGLPPSARKFRTWWANTSNTQSLSWRAAGWHVDKVDVEAQHVRFDRGKVGAQYADRDRNPGIVKRSPATKSYRLTPLGDEIEASIKFQWQEAGALTLDAEGRLGFETLPPTAGIYKMTLMNQDALERRRIYVGESVSLGRRMSHYRNPGPTQHTNIRLNAALIEHLRTGGTVQIAVVVHALLVVGDVEETLDLSRKSCRLAIENIALTMIHLAGTHDVENLQ